MKFPNKSKSENINIWTHKIYKKLFFILCEYTVRSIYCNGIYYFVDTAH